MLAKYIAKLGPSSNSTYLDWVYSYFHFHPSSHPPRVVLKLQGVPQNCTRFVNGNISASIAPRIKMLDILMEPIQLWFQNCPYVNS